MSFSQDFIDKVRDANNLVDVISEYTELKRSGDRLMGLCPFPDHHEKTASFSLSDGKQVYFCFGCKKSGDIIRFLQLMKGLSFPETIEFLADRASIPIPKEQLTRSSANYGQREVKKQMEKLNHLAADHFHLELGLAPQDNPVKQYCRQRGLSEEIIKAFQVGMSLDSWDHLGNYLQHEGQSMDHAAQLGLVKKRSSGNGYYDIFRNRLMFPIISHTGQVVGFGGRALGDDQPKYLNSPESPVFSKGHIFYGLNETAKYIRSADEAIVVEGYMDLLALYGAGIKNVVATLGTALTKDHAKLLKRYTKNVFVLFDGDSAGKKAAERSLPILLSEGLLPRGLFLPENMDPDDFLIKHGAKALNEALQGAPELFNVVLEQALTSFKGSATDKVLAMDRLGPHLKAITDSRLFDLYVEEVANQLGVKVQWVKSALIEAKKPLRAPEKAPERPQKPSEKEITQNSDQKVISDEDIIQVKRPPKSEAYLLNIALLGENYLKRLLDTALIDDISNEGIRKIFRYIQHEYGQNPNKFDKLTSSLVNRVNPPGLVSLHVAGPLAEMDTQEIEKMYKDCSRQIREQSLRAKIKELTATLKTASPADQKEKLEQIMNIQKDRRSLNQDKETN